MTRIRVLWTLMTTPATQWKQHRRSGILSRWGIFSHWSNFCTNTPATQNTEQKPSGNQAKWIAAEDATNEGP